MNPTWSPLFLGAAALLLAKISLVPLVSFAKHRRAIRRRWRQFGAYSIILAAQLTVITLAPYAYLHQSITAFDIQAVCMAVWSAVMIFVPCGITFFKSGWGLLLRNAAFLAAAALILSSV